MVQATVVKLSMILTQPCSFQRGGFSWPHKRAMPPAAAEMDEGDDDDDETDNEGIASECGG